MPGSSSWEREDGLLLYRSRTYVGGPVNPEERERWRRGELIEGGDRHRSARRPGAVGRPHERARTARRSTDPVGATLQSGSSWPSATPGCSGSTHPRGSRSHRGWRRCFLPSALGVESVEVVNGGIPGANAWHMLRRWHYLRDRIAIDGLILGLPHNAPDPDVPALRRAWYQRARGLRQVSLESIAGCDTSSVPTRGHTTRISSARRRTATEGHDTGGSSDHHLGCAGTGPARVDGAVAQRHGGGQDTAMSLAQWVEPLSDGLDGHGGHALRDRNCWGSKDTWHPSAAGYTAIAVWWRR